MTAGVKKQQVSRASWRSGGGYGRALEVTVRYGRSLMFQEVRATIW